MARAPMPKADPLDDVTTSALARLVAREAGVTIPQALRVLRALPTVLYRLTGRGQRVIIRSLGVFFVRDRQGQMRVHPQHPYDPPIWQEGRPYLAFRPSHHDTRFIRRARDEEAALRGPSGD